MNNITHANFGHAPDGTRRILVIDDDANTRIIYEKVLRHAGYHVHRAATIEEARNLLAKFRFDILLCDVCMEDGHYGTDLVFEHAPVLTGQGTHIIMMSADNQYRAMCAALGLDYFMVKPVGIRALVTLIDNLMRNPAGL